MTITDLPERIAGLAPEARARFERLFEVSRCEGQCVVPVSMRPWAIETFGSVEAVERQSVVRVTNTVTWEGAQYNPIRMRRPMPVRTADRGSQSVNGQAPADIFANPLETTAADTFGRVHGKYCVTTSNIARWEGMNTVLIFDTFDPLMVDEAHMRDYFAASREWARRARQAAPDARYFAWMWNGGPMGGASIPHAHAQLALARGRTYAFIERLRLAALGYRAQHGSDYFTDLLAAHADVGLGFELAGLPGLINLGALRGYDTWLFGAAFDDSLASAFARALRALIDLAGTRAFTASVVMPPISADGLPERPDDPDWRGFPFIARIVDRGRADAASSDIGSLDLFGASVIGHDPYLAAAAMRSAAHESHS
ncbi:MAG: hypothetical protein ABIQ99_09415 [Thermoflexales bacterium]